MPAEDWTDEAELAEALNIRRLSLGSDVARGRGKLGEDVARDWSELQQGASGGVTRASFEWRKEVKGKTQQ